MFVRFTLIAAFALLPQTALSQIYKCKSTKGKVIYSEEACSSGTQGEEIHLESNVIDNSAIRKQIAVKQQPSTTLQKIATSTNEISNNPMSSHTKELRLRELKMDMNNQQSSVESRSDARNEFNYLNKTPINALSYEDELKRRNLKIDLESNDISNRSKAMSLLVQIYLKY